MLAPTGYELDPNIAIYTIHNEQITRQQYMRQGLIIVTLQGTPPKIVLVLGAHWIALQGSTCINQEEIFGIRIEIEELLE